jgi:ATP/maltotriose-dependent transcriptional regulator MalT
VGQPRDDLDLARLHVGSGEAHDQVNPLCLIPLDEERQWWRYHQLFADLLRVRLQHERGERKPDLHRAAATWHEAHGFSDEAVRHAAAAGEVAWTARLVELNVEGLLRRSEGATLSGWLSTLPAETLRTRPRLGLARAVKAAVESDPKKLDSLLADAEGAFATIGDEPHKPSVDDLERLRRAFGDGSAARRGPDRTDAADAGVVEPLTGREMQVLGLMAVGMSNQEIADELVVALDTVKKHVGHIFDKLGAANRTQAVARARVMGLVR